MENSPTPRSPRIGRSNEPMEKIDQILFATALALISTGAYASLGTEPVSQKQKATDPHVLRLKDSVINTPALTFRGTAPASLPVIDGAGRGESLLIALSQIMPVGWNVYCKEAMDDQFKVDWSGPGNWITLLNNLADQSGMNAVVDWSENKITLELAKAPGQPKETTSRAPSKAMPAIAGRVQAGAKGQTRIAVNDSDNPPAAASQPVVNNTSRAAVQDPAKADIENSFTLLSKAPSEVKLSRLDEKATSQISKIARGEQFDTSLAAYAQQNNWTFYWYPGVTWKAIADIDLSHYKDATDAVADIISGLREEGKPVQIRISEGNRVMEVLSTEVRND